MGLESPQQLVLFNEAALHIARFTRVLKMQKGHMVVIGQGGSGKKSLAFLSAVIAECKLFEIIAHKKYTNMDFREDIKKVFKEIIISEDSYMFFLSYKHIVDSL